MSNQIRLMQIACPRCGSAHEVDVTQPRASFLCVGCRVPVSDQQRVWLHGKHAKTMAERKRKRKVWNEALRQYERKPQRPT